MAKGGAGKQKAKSHKMERVSRPGGAPKADAGRAARRNAANQHREHQRMRVLEQHRASGGSTGAPMVVALVAAGEDADTAALARLLLGHDATSAATGTSDNATVVISKLRKRLTLLRPARNMESVLEAAKAADVLLLAIPVDGLDATGEHLVDAICMQGVGTVVGALQGIEKLPQRLQAPTRKKWSNSLEERFPDNAKLFSVDLDADGAQLVRHLAALTPRPVSWRKNYSYLLSHSHAYAADAGGEGGTLKVSGYVRGMPLSVNQLVHVAGVGEFQPESIEVLADPHPLLTHAQLRALTSGGGGGGAASMQLDGDDAEMDDEGGGATARQIVPTVAVSAAYAAETDGLNAEQTWPTEAELAEAEMAGGGAMSDDEVDEDEDEDEDEERIKDREILQMDESEEAEARRLHIYERCAARPRRALAARPKAAPRLASSSGRTRPPLHLRAAAAAPASARSSLREEDAKFPDEVDTPLDVPARERFARYRGLKSFRSSPWHPQENLPPDYSRIYQFEDWPTLQKQGLQSALAADEEGAADAGAFVCVTLRVPAAFERTYGASGAVGTEGIAAPLILAGVNEYENKLTVVHFAVSLTAAAEAQALTIKGKQPLIFHCGFRKFTAQPIFSEDTRRSDKHRARRRRRPLAPPPPPPPHTHTHTLRSAPAAQSRRDGPLVTGVSRASFAGLERFLQPGRPSVATIYAPALYAPAPLLAFLPQSHPESGTFAGLPVASGSLFSVDPNRIILKKVLLTGHPFRCHKKKAVVRWMFFSKEDIRWFRPVELHTKFGRKGNIRESLGTHGYMKCIFDGVVHQHDTVCMSLYKRAFPKWRDFSYAVEEE